MVGLVFLISLNNPFKVNWIKQLVTYETQPLFGIYSLHISLGDIFFPLVCNLILTKYLWNFRQAFLAWFRNNIVLIDQLFNSDVFLHLRNS